jgi:branched-chain amino acid transport system substrate-binding protein
MNNKRNLLKIAAALVLTGAAALPAYAQNVVKVGLILPMTGPFASTGRQIEAAARLYMAQNGTTVAGKKLELILKDDGGVPDTAKRLAQELIINDKVSFLAGFGLTPMAFSTAPIATQAKVPMIVMAAATSSIPEKSPFIVRSGFTIPQAAAPMADWAFKNGIKKVVTLVTDYGPGIDAQDSFKARFTQQGGQVIDELRVPLKNPDFSPFLQRMSDTKPDAVFVFVPSGAGAVFMKQFIERGLDKSGIKLIGTGDVTDDDLLNDMGDAAIGVVTSHHYSAAHDTAVNKAFVTAFEKANKGMRPNFMAVGGYDGMHLIYASLEKTKGDTKGEALVAAMKGMTWESPRGKMTIDPDTRDVIQDIYIRKVQRVNGQLYNVEFDRIQAVKDPGKTSK